MFDSCRHWQMQLARRADGVLPPDQRNALDYHLMDCARCRSTQEADQALRDSVRLNTEMLSSLDADLFDERVLADLRKKSRVSTANRPTLAGAVRALRTRMGEAQLEFFTQIMGGALVAASVTVFCLSHALHPVSAALPAKESSASLSALSNRSDPPVPLESLLESPSPRAALLWTATSDAKLDNLTVKRRGTHKLPL